MAKNTGVLDILGGRLLIFYKNLKRQCQDGWKHLRAFVLTHCAHQSPIPIMGVESKHSGSIANEETRGGVQWPWSLSLYWAHTKKGGVKESEDNLPCLLLISSELGNQIWNNFFFFYTSTAVEPGALAGITLNMSWCDSLSAVPLGANRLYNFFRGGGLLNNVVHVSVKAKGGGGEEGGFARHVLSSE